MEGLGQALGGASTSGRMQATWSSSLRGSQLQQQRRACRPAQRGPASPVARAAATLDLGLEQPRLRLDNIAPQPGSRRRNKRKGRGHAAGQGGSCGFGTAGQKSRSGSGTRPGFQGGQTPLYRQLPKLRGIAGGMSAGLPKHVTVNIKDLNAKFGEGETVSLATLREKKILNVSGSQRKLPLKVLGQGQLAHKLTIRAAQFSAGAKEKIEAAGGTAELEPQRPKWTRKLGKARKEEAAKAAAEGLPNPYPRSSTKAGRKAARREASTG